MKVYLRVMSAGNMRMTRLLFLKEPAAYLFSIFITARVSWIIKLAQNSLEGFNIKFLHQLKDNFNTTQSLRYKIVLDTDSLLYAGHNRIDHTVTFPTIEGSYDNRANSFKVCVVADEIFCFLKYYFLLDILAKQMCVSSCTTKLVDVTHIRNILCFMHFTHFNISSLFNIFI